MCHGVCHEPCALVRAVTMLGLETGKVAIRIVQCGEIGTFHCDAGLNALTPAVALSGQPFIPRRVKWRRVPTTA